MDSDVDFASVFSHPALSPEHSVCLMQEVAGFLRLRLRDKRQSRSTSKSKSRLRCGEGQWAQDSACAAKPDVRVS